MLYPEQVSPERKGDRLCSDEQERVMGVGGGGCLMNRGDFWVILACLYPKLLTKMPQAGWLQTAESHCLCLRAEQAHFSGSAVYTAGPLPGDITKPQPVSGLL